MLSTLQLYPFCLHLGVYAGRLPEKLAPCAVVVGDETNTTTFQSPVFISSSHADDTEHAPEGRRAITATVFLKESPLVLADLELKRIANSIIDTLEGFLPFLRESIDFVNIEKSIELSRRSQEIVCQKYPPRKGDDNRNEYPLAENPPKQCPPDRWNIEGRPRF